MIFILLSDGHVSYSALMFSNFSDIVATQSTVKRSKDDELTLVPFWVCFDGYKRVVVENLTTNNNTCCMFS